MPLLIRKYKGNSGVMQEERIDDPDRIERYLRLFDKDDVKKLETGVKTFIEKDEWQLLPKRDLLVSAPTSHSSLSSDKASGSLPLRLVA